MIRLLLVLLVAFIAASESALAAIPSSVEVACDVDRSAFVRAARDQANVTFRLWTAVTGGSQVGGDYVVPMTDLVVLKSAVQSYDGVRRRSFLTLRSKLPGPVNLGTGEVWLDVSVGSSTLTCDFGLHRNPALAFPPPARKKLEAVAFARESSHSETCETCTTTTDISARVFKSTNFSTNSSASAAVTFDSERWDTSGIYSPGDPTKLCAPTAGKYYIFGHAGWEANASGLRSIGIRLNGTTHLAVANMPGSAIEAANDQSVSTHYELGVGDCVELVVFQVSGTGLEIRADANFSPEFGMAKLP